MRVRGGLVHAEHGCHAGVGPGKDLCPLIAAAGGEYRGELAAQLGPARPVQLRGQIRPGQPQARQQGRVELRFQGADRHIAAAGGLVGVIERGAAIEQVGAALVLPRAAGAHAVQERGQQGRAVHHGRVDHLALARALPLDQGGQDAQGQQHAAAAEVADQVQRRHRPLACPADRGQRAGDGNVVDVVPGRRRQRAILAPPRHPAEDEPRIAPLARLRAEAQPLGHSRPEPLDQHVSVVGQPQQQVDPGRVLEVEPDRPAPADERVSRRAGLRPAALGPVDPQHVRAQVGQDHAAKRRWRQAGDLDDPHAFQWTHPCLPAIRLPALPGAGPQPRRRASPQLAYAPQTSLPALLASSQLNIRG